MKRDLKKCFFVLLLLSGAFTAYGQNDYGVHDPSNIVKVGDRYYTFYTSNGVECAYSTDLCTWRKGSRIFPSGFPSWITQYVPEFGGHFWAPEVVYMNNKWHVYYSCSSFGSRQSAIGLATSPSLTNPNWQDQGMVVYTNNSSNHNAIDADVMRTSDGKAYLIYGSFWNGIVMTELDTTTGKPFNRTNLTYVANGNPEAGAAIQHGDYYYLFFNRGKCCDGVNSTYQIFVGRSTNPLGPFVDKNGTKTSSNGGTLILSTRGRFIGPGHFGLFKEGNYEFMSYHYYDANQNGASKLKISTITWQDGWPVVNTDFNPCDPRDVKDCAGVNNGTAYLDQCGTCVGGNTGKQPCTRDCNGDWGGDASTDECGVCVGGKTGLVPCTGSIQGEDAFDFDGVFEDVNAGFIGSGYLNFHNETGTTASYSICSDAASRFDLVLRYANGSSAARNLSVSVNGTVQVNNLQIPSTGSWTEWRTAKVSLVFLQGNNIIIFTSLSSEGGPNLDVISFSDSRLHKCATHIKDIKKTITNSSVDYKNGVISLCIKDGISATLKVYSISGKLIKTLFSGQASQESYRIRLNSSNLTKGTYLLVLEDNLKARHEKVIHVW